MTATIAPRRAETASTRELFTTVTWAVASRGLLRVSRLPSLIFPVVFMPIFFVVAFSGSFSSITEVRGYGTDEAVNWMTAWALLQGSAFGGVGAAGFAATDLENGFFDRLLLSPVNRLALLAGSVLYGVVRSLIPVTLVMIVAILLGADLEGGALGVLMAYVGGAGIALVMSLFGLGVVYRLQSLRSLAVIQIGVFSVMFLSIGQAPLEAMDGWLYHVARLNPVTNVIRLTRQGFLGDVTWATTWPGLLALAAMTAVFGGFAHRGLVRIRP